MKFSRILCTTALLGLALGLSAAAAHADGSDPTVKVNRTPTDPLCNPISDPTCLVAGGSVALNLNGITTLDIGGTEDILTLSVTFAGVDGDSYDCFTDIFTTCKIIFHQLPGGGFNVTDLFAGGPGKCLNNGDEDPAGQCAGFLAPGDQIDVQGIFPDGTGPVEAAVNTPEPSTILLMGLGLGVLFALSRKRVASGLPA
jgi:PEP-CTERM motif